LAPRHVSSPLFETAALGALQGVRGRLPNCTECRLAVAHTRKLASHARPGSRAGWGPSKDYHAKVIEDCCCTRDGDGGEA
jgi:hypothetical protein